MAIDDFVNLLAKQIVATVGFGLRTNNRPHRRIAVVSCPQFRTLRDSIVETLTSTAASDGDSMTVLECDISWNRFKDGRRNVNIPQCLKHADVEVFFLTNADEDMGPILMTLKALMRGRTNPRTHIIIPQLPYARDDCHYDSGPGNEHVMMAYESVHLLRACIDSAKLSIGSPHTLAVLNSANEELDLMWGLLNTVMTTVILASDPNARVVIGLPDEGAKKRLKRFIEQALRVFSPTVVGVIVASKERDAGGTRTSERLDYCNCRPSDVTPGTIYLFVDDIVSSGRTLIDCVKVCKKAAATEQFRAFLLVAHACMPSAEKENGELWYPAVELIDEAVRDKTIEHLYTTSSNPACAAAISQQSPNITVLPVVEDAVVEMIMTNDR
jgi:phosphoribosylpyrophosphate synthetase